MRIVIVGGVAGGMSAATRLRRLNEEAEIIVLEKGPYVSFANCGLPYHISGEISERSSLIVQSPKAIHSRFNIDVRTEYEVTGISPEANSVNVLHNGEKFSIEYDHLILSMGAKPFVPPIKNIEKANNVFTLRNIPDLDKILNALESKPKEAVVVGAGFIGLEVAENLKQLGMNVTIVEMAQQVLPPLDEEMAAFVENELVKNDIRVITSHSATAFGNNGKQVILDDGTVLESDLTIMSVGVVPNSDIAKAAGIELGQRGGIVVDESYRTNIDNIYAVGDAIIVKQQITNQPALIALASPANRQGRQVADVISGKDVTNKGSIGTSIVRVFDLSAASTGLSERAAKQADLNPSVVHISGKDHAGYFPGATPVHLKLVFNKDTGEIYGAQGIGQKGIDKRIDIIATAIKGGLTVEDLPELELTYAPPFGAAKDPVNMIGYAALNILDGISENIQWYELNDEIKSGKVFLDVRGENELINNGAFAFENHLNIPLNELRGRLDELDKDQEYIVSCHSGQRSYIAERVLKQKGFNVKNLDGAFSLYNTIRPDEIKK
ncbi:MAG TPA: FAD-dependent oxidoreductase [Alloiococcus sp.]|nr:FAD-dependent oxidoreductase [Alloiococcus sp.]